MSYSSGLQTVAASSVYGPPVVCPGAAAVILTIANAACVIQQGRGVGAPMWGEDSYRLPGVWVLPGPIDALRVRAAATVNPANPPRWSADA